MVQQHPSLFGYNMKERKIILPYWFFLDGACKRASRGLAWIDVGGPKLVGGP